MSSTHQRVTRVDRVCSVEKFTGPLSLACMLGPFHCSRLGESVFLFFIYPQLIIHKLELISRAWRHAHAYFTDI